MTTTTKAVRTAEDRFADELIRQHLAGHITVRGIIGEAFRQGVTHGEAKSAAPELRELNRDMLVVLDALVNNENAELPYLIPYTLKIAREAIKKARGL